MPDITVYTKPACVQCNATKRALTKNNIPFKTVDVTEDEAAYNFVVSLGYAAAPVVVVGDAEAHWSGYQPDRINELVAAAAA